MVIYNSPMVIAATCKELELAEAMRAVSEGAAWIDLRPTDAYLDAHIPGSLALLYEYGPGLAGRARDCLPLSLPLVLFDPGDVDVINAANSLRGKGFAVLGRVPDALNRWAAETGRSPASTEIVTGPRPDGFLLDVGDPGVSLDAAPDAHIPIERLWSRTGEVAGRSPIVIAAGYGVRAALAVGMLERAGAADIVMWRTRG